MDESAAAAAADRIVEIWAAHTDVVDRICTSTSMIGTLFPPMLNSNNCYTVLYVLIILGLWLRCITRQFRLSTRWHSFMGVQLVLWTLVSDLRNPILKAIYNTKEQVVKEFCERPHRRGRIFHGKQCNVTSTSLQRCMRLPQSRCHRYWFFCCVKRHSTDSLSFSMGRTTPRIALPVESRPHLIGPTWFLGPT